MSRTWLYCDDGVEVRSTTSENLEELLTSGGLPEQGLVWTAPMPDWARAMHFPWIRSKLEGGKPPPPPASAHDDPLKRIFAAVAYLFKHRARISPFLPVMLIQFFPPLAALINRGWRISFLEADPADPFPRFQLGRNIADSLVMWAMYFLYLFPYLVFALFRGLDAISNWIIIGQWLLSLVSTGAPPSGTGALAAETVIGFVLGSGFILFYPILTWPFFRVGMMRYARERRVGVFFEPWANLKTVRENFPLLMHLYFQNKVLWLISAIVASAATATLVGLVFLPAIAAIRLLASGVLYRETMWRIFPPERTAEVPAPAFVPQPVAVTPDRPPSPPMPPPLPPPLPPTGEPS